MRYRCKRCNKEFEYGVQPSVVPVWPVSPYTVMAMTVPEFYTVKSAPICPYCLSHEIEEVKP